MLLSFSLSNLTPQNDCDNPVMQWFHHKWRVSTACHLLLALHHLCLSIFSCSGEGNLLILLVDHDVNPDIQSSSSLIYPVVCLCDKGSLGLASLSLLLPSMFHSTVQRILTRQRWQALSWRHGRVQVLYPWIIQGWLLCSIIAHESVIADSCDS
jgi:hypothetical protein